MPQRNLFSAEQRLEPLNVDPRRSEPIVWIRRLVILSRPNVTAVVRPIPFHRGLNIIRTEKRGPTDTGSVAHDVGKTLLMRLLRFTLGEDSYASKDDAARINKALPRGVVAAEWFVGGQLWSVVRPLSDHEGGHSFAVSGRSWERAIESTIPDREPLSKFVERVEDAALGELPALHLKGGPAGWRDVLAWIARDCECGFRKPDAWRDREVNSKGLRDPKLNKLIMQWLMGLMPEREASARDAKEENKKRLKEAENDVHLKRERLQTLFDSLANSAEFEIPQIDESSEPPSLVDRAEELRAFVQNEASRSKTDLEAFEKQVNGEIETLRLREKLLEDQKTAAVREAGEWRTRHRMLTRQHGDEEKRETGPRNCPAKDECAWLIQIESDDAAGRMSSEELHLGRLKEEIGEALKKANKASEKEERLTEQHRTTQEELAERRADAANRLPTLQKEFGRWESLATRIDELATAIDELSEAGKVAETIRSLIADDEERLARGGEDGSLRVRLRTLQHSYIRVLTHVFGDDAEGDVVIDDGLRPTTAATLGAHGTALSAMARVIAYELGCLLASMCGLGSHPRLLMHDGPRQGEMEDELFRILFQTASWLESISPGPDAAFQYIMATADAPDEFTENHPAVVLTLQGRDKDGLLLKRRF